MTPEQRFWHYVGPQPKDSCWLWRGYRNPSGYGRICFNSSHVAAHRFSYELHKGPIPDRLLVCHTCDVKACVNPAHLYAGTHADNTRDAFNRGLCKRGVERHNWRGGPSESQRRYYLKTKKAARAALKNKEKQP